MTTTPDAFYASAIRRIYRNIGALAGAGTIAAFAWKGWTAGAGFLFGAAVSWFAFAAFHHLANRLGSSPEAPRGQAKQFAVAWMIGFRWVAVGATGYGIIKYLGINKVALLAGLMVLAAAVLAEILFELIFLRDA